MSTFLEAHHLLSHKQFGFRGGRSAADLLLLQSATWNKTLDCGHDTFVIALDIAGAFDRVWHQGLTSKLKSLGINGFLLHLLEDYLQDRSLQVVVNGHSSSKYPIKASVPQGSVLGPLLWNIYFNDILQLVPEAYAYADDCTLTFTCDRHDRQATLLHINQTLHIIQSWGRRWQVEFASGKTQAMLISRRPEPTDSAPVNLKLGGRTLPLQESVNILGVEFNNTLTFTGHVKQLAKTAAWKLGCVRRIAHLLDAKGVDTVYKAQVRSVMEYSPLAWSSCPPSHLKILDKVQRRAERLIMQKCTRGEVISLQRLQHRRDVAGLCVMYKVHKQHSPHLSPLRLQPPPTPVHSTRGAEDADQQVAVPFARTELYLRSFLPRYARLWNGLVRHTSIHHSTSMQQFKTKVNLWLQDY